MLEETLIFGSLPEIPGYTQEYTEIPRNTLKYPKVKKMVKTSLTLGSPGCWFDVTTLADTQKIAVDCALMTKSKGETLFQTRADLGRCIQDISGLYVL